MTGARVDNARCSTDEQDVDIQIEQLTALGSLAEYERELINERAADARAAAKARGRLTGRPSRLTEDQARQLRALHGSGETVADLCRSFKISRATVYRVLERGQVSA